MMNKILIVLVVLVSLFTAPVFAIEADYLPLSFVFPLVTTNAGTGAVSTVAFVAPENITIKSLYVTETSGVVASSTDYATFSLKVGSAVVQAHSTNAVNLTAMTPAAFTLDASKRKIAKGSVVTLALTKVGTGVAATTPNVQLNYIIGW